MSLLSQVSCTEIRADETPVSAEEIAALHPLVPSWSILVDSGVRKLRHTFGFDDPGTAQRFTRLVEETARKEGRQPHIDWQGISVVVEWWSPELQDLHPNDFIMAGKTDGAFTQAVVGAQGDMTTEEPLPTLADVPRFRHTFSGRSTNRKAANER